MCLLENAFFSVTPSVFLLPLCQKSAFHYSFLYFYSFPYDFDILKEQNQDCVNICLSLFELALELLQQSFI